MVLRATPVARAVAATPPWPALCASAATCNRRARSSSDGRTASNRSAMGFSSIIPPPYRDHGAARITQPFEAPTDALISGRRLTSDRPGDGARLLKRILELAVEHSCLVAGEPTSLKPKNWPTDRPWYSEPSTLVEWYRRHDFAFRT